MTTVIKSANLDTWEISAANCSNWHNMVQLGIKKKIAKQNSEQQWYNKGEMMKAFVNNPFTYFRGY